MEGVALWGTVRVPKRMCQWRRRRRWGWRQQKGGGGGGSGGRGGTRDRDAFREGSIGGSSGGGGGGSGRGEAAKERRAEAEAAANFPGNSAEQKISRVGRKLGKWTWKTDRELGTMERLSSSSSTQRDVCENDGPQRENNGKVIIIIELIKRVCDGLWKLVYWRKNILSGAKKATSHL